jgi:uncharacterized protein (UPF0548 family)
MFTFRRPTAAQRANYLRDKRNSAPSYNELGCTARTTPVPGFWRDEARVELGRGRELFEVACQQVLSGEFFPPAMIELHLAQATAAAGDTVAVVYRCPLLPLWLTLPTRITHCFDEIVSLPTGERHRCGFTYGTLPGHRECGEERFEVEWDAATDGVTFSIVAVSRPATRLAWLVLPYVRLEQARFRRLVTQRMQRLVTGVACDSEQGVEQGATAC